MAGDFNARDIDWDSLTPTQECRKKGLCDKLISILGEGQVHQMQRENTRGDAILDLFCTNKPSLVKSIGTIPGLSDHDGIVLADILVKAQINKKPQRRVFVWSKDNWDAIKSETIAFSEEFMTSYRDMSVEENWDTLVNHLMSSQDKHIPSKLSSMRYNVPWLTSTIRRMCRKKRRLYRRAKKSGKQEHMIAFKAIQNETRDALRQAHWAYVNSILVDGLERGDVKPFYGYVKSQQQDSQGVSPLRERGQLFSDAPSKARILSEQFKSVFTRDNPEVADTRLPGPDLPDIRPLNISPQGVEKLLKDLNPRKASGPDEAPARVLHNLAKEVAPALTAIFSQSIETGELPSQWKKAWIAPVF